MVGERGRVARNFELFFFFFFFFFHVDGLIRVIRSINEFAADAVILRLFFFRKLQLIATVQVELCYRRDEKLESNGGFLITRFMFLYCNTNYTAIKNQILYNTDFSFTN